jgi:hypothetical protein
MKSQTGWIVLSYSLTIVLIVFVILWAIQIDKKIPPNVCSSSFGVIPGLDANAISSCGTNKSDLCVFSRGSLSSCETECNLIPDICKAFTFNQSASIMKIVDPSGVTFSSFSTNKFVRQ